MSECFMCGKQIHQTEPSVIITAYDNPEAVRVEVCHYKCFIDSIQGSEFGERYTCREIAEKIGKDEKEDY